MIRYNERLMDFICRGVSFCVILEISNESDLQQYYHAFINTSTAQLVDAIVTNFKMLVAWRNYKRKKLFTKQRLYQRMALKIPCFRANIGSRKNLYLGKLASNRKFTTLQHTSGAHVGAKISYDLQKQVIPCNYTKTVVSEIFRLWGTLARVQCRFTFSSGFGGI